MSERGRPAKPSKVKQLHGTDRKDRMNQNEPKPNELERIPEPPWYLDYYAKKEWNRAAKHLIDVGLLTEADLTVFQEYCEVHGHCVRLHQKIRDEDYEFVTESGYHQKRPIVSILQDFQKEKRKLANQLGLSPSARTKIEVDVNKSDGPSVEDILNGNAG